MLDKLTIIDEGRVFWIVWKDATKNILKILKEAQGVPIIALWMFFRMYAPELLIQVLF